MLGFTVMGGCGPVVAVDTSESSTETESDDAGLPVTPTTDGDSDVPTTGTTTGESQPTTRGEESSSSDSGATESESEGSGTTGEPDLACPEDDWPSDGSEVVLEHSVSSVDAWTFAGNGETHFTFLSEESAIPGELSRGIRAEDAAPEPGTIGFGAAMSSMSAEPFLGQRVRMRAWVGRNDVAGQGNLWLRFDGPGFQYLDNGSDQPRYGTSRDWELEEIVMDVPDNATNIAFGSLLIGSGTILVNDPTFEIVSDDVPTTQPNQRRPEGAQLCGGELGRFVEERVHILRPESWARLADATTGELARDERVRYDEVPSVRMSGDLGGAFGGVLLWASQREGQRLRLTVSIRAEGFSGEARLVFSSLEGENLVAHQSTPLQLDDRWQAYSVVTEIPVGVGLMGSRVGVTFAGASGDVWVGYGVVEQVTDDVPLSELAQ